VANWTQPFRQIRPIIGFWSMIRVIASGVVSITNNDRIGLWTSTICQGGSGPEVAGRPVHHAEERREVVRELGPRPEAIVVDVREVVFEVDPRADRDDRQQDPGQDRAVGVVPRRVVRGKECPPVEKQAAGPLAATDDRDGVGGVPEFGPGLRQVLGALLDVLAGCDLTSRFKVDPLPIEASAKHSR